MVKKFTIVLACIIPILLVILLLTTKKNTSSNISQINKPETSVGKKILAFPGAEGWGNESKGGRGGKVIFVTSLNDSGPGSFREAITTQDPRVIIFKVGGTITLKKDIVIKNPYITIAGQTAPGDGIQIKGAAIVLKTHDVIIRYLRLRPGDEINQSDNEVRDALNFEATNGIENKNIIVDHSTLVWGPDAGAADIMQNSHHITIQDSILGEGLWHSNHPEASGDRDHSMGMLITQLHTDKYGPGYPNHITLYRNLFTSNSDRNPRVMGGEYIDIVNNVVYNWWWHPARGNPRKLNLINNAFIKGPRTKKLVAWEPGTNDVNPDYYSNSVYEVGNTTEGFTQIRGEPNNVYTTSRFEYSVKNQMTSTDAYNYIVSSAGAILPKRDASDQRIITQLISRTGTFISGENFQAPHPDWPDLKTGTPYTDSDNDGMEDAWEQKYFTSTTRGSETSTLEDFDSDGYSDLEEFLNQTDPTKKE